MKKFLIILGLVITTTLSFGQSIYNATLDSAATPYPGILPRYVPLSWKDAQGFYHITHLPLTYFTSGGIGGGTGPGVSSFNNRSNAVVPQPGDYSPFFYTKGHSDSAYVSLQGHYNDPSWINNVSLAKLLAGGATDGQVLTFVNGSGWLPRNGASGTAFNLNNIQYYGVKYTGSQSFVLPNTPTRIYYVQVWNGTSPVYNPYATYTWSGTGSTVTIGDALQSGDSLVFHYDIGTANGTIASGTPQVNYVPVWNGTTAVWQPQSGSGSSLNGTGFVKASGTTITYDNTTYAPLASPNFSGVPTLNGPTTDSLATKSYARSLLGQAGTAYNLNNEVYYGVKWVSGQTFTMPSMPTKFYYVQVLNSTTPMNNPYALYTWTPGSTAVTVGDALQSGDSLVFHYDAGTANGTIASGTPLTGYVPVWNGTVSTWQAPNNTVFQDSLGSYWVLKVLPNGALRTDLGTSGSGPISNYYLFTGTTSQVTLGNGTYTARDTTLIPNFYQMVRAAQNNSAGGPSSITLTTSNVLYGTPVTFTNTSGAWSGALSLISQSANKVLASPLGSSGTPTFRSSDSADFGGKWVAEVQAAQSVSSFNGVLSGVTPSYVLTTTGDSRSATISRVVASDKFSMANTILKPGGAGNAIQFTSPTNGWMQFANTGMPTGTSATISFSFWFSMSGNGDIFYYNTTTGTSDFRIFTFSNQIWIKGSTGTQINTTVTFTANTWNHVVVTVNGSTATIYLNGASAASGSISTNSFAISSGLSEIIGGGGSQKMDQFLVYNRTLTSGDVTTIYNSGGGTPSYPTSGLIRDYEFEDGTGTTVTDINPSGTTYNGTLNTGNFTWLGVGSGKTPTSTAPSTSTGIAVIDGAQSNENGIWSFGDALGTTNIQGTTINTSAGMTIGGPILSVGAITSTGAFSTSGAITSTGGSVTGKRFIPTAQTSITATATTTVDLSAGSVVTLNMAASITTLTLSNSQTGTYRFYITQDATGSRTIIWPGTVKWSGGTAPTLTTTANKTDIITLEYNSLANTYYGTYSLNY